MTETELKCCETTRETIPQITLKCVDLLTGDTVWQRSDYGSNSPYPVTQIEIIDGELWASQPRDTGRIRIIDVDDGTVIADTADFMIQDFPAAFFSADPATGNFVVSNGSQIRFCNFGSGTVSLIMNGSRLAQYYENGWILPQLTIPATPIYPWRKIASDGTVLPGIYRASYPDANNGKLLLYNSELRQDPAVSYDWLAYYDGFVEMADWVETQTQTEPYLTKEIHPEIIDQGYETWVSGEWQPATPQTIKTYKMEDRDPIPGRLPTSCDASIDRYAYPEEDAEKTGYLLSDSNRLRMSYEWDRPHHMWQGVMRGWYANMPNQGEELRMRFGDAIVASGYFPSNVRGPYTPLLSSWVDFGDDPGGYRVAIINRSGSMFDCEFVDHGTYYTYDFSVMSYVADSAGGGIDMSGDMCCVEGCTTGEIIWNHYAGLDVPNSPLTEIVRTESQLPTWPLYNPINRVFSVFELPEKIEADYELTNYTYLARPLLHPYDAADRFTRHKYRARGNWEFGEINFPGTGMYGDNYDGLYNYGFGVTGTADVSAYRTLKLGQYLAEEITSLDVYSYANKEAIVVSRRDGNAYKITEEMNANHEGILLDAASWATELLGRESSVGWGDAKLAVQHNGLLYWPVNINLSRNCVLAIDPDSLEIVQAYSFGTGGQIGDIEIHDGKLIMAGLVRG